MGDISNGCLSCGKNCINVEFCSEGASYQTLSNQAGFSLPRNLKVVITANPAYWGFGGVLTSGYVSFSNGHYDYFEGFDEDWIGTSTCSDGSTQISANEKRPDVTYRSVYDPDDGTITHYDGVTVEDTGRGGAVAYLINRSPGQVGIGGTEDKGTCPEIQPPESFKLFPENFGWANKIHFDTSLYKNLTSAWRMVDHTNCYPQINVETYDSASELAGNGTYSQAEYITCSGKPKQNLAVGTLYAGKYFDLANIRVTGLNVLENTTQDTSCLVKGCFPDGHVAGEYAGEFAESGQSGITQGGFYRASGETGNLKVFITYKDWSNSAAKVPASGIRSGQTMLIKCTGVTDREGFYVVEYADHIPQGVGTHIGKKGQEYNKLGYGYSAVYLMGTYGSTETSVDISGADGSWSVMNSYDPNTCCSLEAHGVDNFFKNLNCAPNYHSDFKRVFNDSKFKIQSNRSPENRFTYDYGTVSPRAGITGARKDCTYPGFTTNGEADLEVNAQTGYTANFPRELPYYGPFYSTDELDNETRGAVKLNTTIQRNATCFSKKATLEVFPDCLTQYIQYSDCTDGGATKYKVNRVPRLSFVYRGCDYHDYCEFDESGRPYTEPTSIDDLRRGRGGEEIHMFLNLGTAWGGVAIKCSCNGGGGTEPTLIKTIGVESPVTFPTLPDFDLNPTAFGCDDDTFVAAQYLRYGTDFNPDGESSPDPTPLQSGSVCSPLPSFPQSCTVRQPYTTYGYIMNLCGMRDMSRRGVVEAFNNLTQSGTCTHSNHVSGCSGLVEPFYRGFTIPTPAPFSNGDYWQVSGVLDTDIINEKIGDNVGYWGLRDENGALVAPYYRTSSGNITCPFGGSVNGYIGFSNSGNYIDGWPTDDVPFLIQIETETRCAGCTTAVMDTGNLTITIESLPTKFLHQITHANGATASTLVGGMYGYQHCNYNNFSLDATDTFNCTSGFADNYCLASYTGYSGVEEVGRNTDNGDAFYKIYGIPHSGETCAVLSGVTVTLNNRQLGSSVYTKGWVTGTPEKPYVKLFTINDSDFLHQTPAAFRKSRSGFSVYAKFGLGCPSMNAGAGNNSNVDYTMPLKLGNSAYLSLASDDAVRISFGSQNCPGSYPTTLGSLTDGRDLALAGQFWAVHPDFEGMFEAFDRYQFEFHQDTLAPDGRIIDIGIDGNGLPLGNNIFGLCSGDQLWAHGCFLKSGDPGVTMGSNTSTLVINGVTGMFHGVSGAGCDGGNLSLCTTCEKTDYPNTTYVDGDVVCDPACTGADAFLGMGTGNTDGNPESAAWGWDAPTEYQLNNCYCLCQDPEPFVVYTITGFNGDAPLHDGGSGLYADSGLDPADPSQYWWSASRAATNETGISGIGPYLSQLNFPSNPFIGFDLGGVSPEDWFNYSHGVNSLVAGIQHDLVPPKLNVQSSSPGEGCNTLTVKTCETGYDQFGDTHAGCAIDPTNRVNSANCKEPIYNSGWNDSGIKTNVEVQRKACFPETMIVNKIKCSYFNGYPYFDLLVSREFFSHDRTWKLVKDLGDGNGCYPHLVGAYLTPYVGASGDCSGCTPLPYAVPSDLVTPVYETPCSTHPSTGAHVNQDFVYSSVGASNSGSPIGGGGGGGGGPGGPPPVEEGGGSGWEPCRDGVPAATGGDDLWNYFNLFYYSGWPNNGAGTSPVFGIYESGAYIPKLSQTDDDGGAAGDGVCPSAVPLDTSDYNYNPPHESKMLATGVFAQPNGLFGILETNSKHSCLQDVSECGGELWCHKIFFPRRNYKGSSTYMTPGYLQTVPYSTDTINGDGTLVAPFGATALCRANAQFLLEERYQGWNGADGPFSPTNANSNYTIPDYIKYEIKERFFDVCDNKILTEVYPFNVGIDDSRVSVRDYLPLVGVIHPGWRTTVASKSCVILSTGCSNHYTLPTHTDQSIRVGLFAPKTYFANRFDSMGYYLDKAGDTRFASTGNQYQYLSYRNIRPAGGGQTTDHSLPSGTYPASGQPNLPLQKLGATASDDCLFAPFKILVDVECSTNRHKRLGIPTDEPTNLSFISQFPGAACSGLRQQPRCGCSETDCADNLPPHRASQERVMQLKELYEVVEVDCDSNCNALSPKESGLYQPVGSGLLSNIYIMERCTTVAMTGGVWLDGDFSVTGLADTGSASMCSGCDYYYNTTSLPTGYFVFAPKSGEAPSCTPDKSRIFLVDGLGANTTGEFTNYWECANHLYVHSTNNGGLDPCNKLNALCDSEYRFPLPLDCRKCYIIDEGGIGDGIAEDKLTQGGFTGIYNEHPRTGWWQSDCGCEFLRSEDSQCTDSIVKMTITE